MDDIKAKQQIVEKIKSSTNILVTVSNNPSVDALSAALGLTLLLDKLEKHPTAVFSGEVPPAISFLKPEETFDETTDSLRDFIIALDKEKADHLRYKVEGDSVKIFITPYKTTITSSDLEFSQGDFNVELVIALGVDVQEHLDGALESHGQILHDADIITVTAGGQVSNIGGIDWHDDQASSLSEMVSGLAEALKSDKNKSLLDASIATAFLTGIVAETDRFSNTHTTSRVMTVAAQLMGAGADQQLIASKLQESHEIGGNLDVNKATSAVKDDTLQPAPAEVAAPEHKEILSISHKPTETLEDMDKRVKAAEQAEAIAVADEALTVEQHEHTGNSNAAGAYAFDNENHKDAVIPEVAEVTAVTLPTPTIVTEPSTLIEPSVPSQREIEPSLGGTLNATSEQAAEDARREEEGDQNKTILTHSYLDSSPAAPEKSPGSVSAYDLGPDDTVITGAPMPDAQVTPPHQTMGHELVIEPPSMPAASSPADFGLPMPPPLPDFSSVPVSGSAYAVQEASSSQPEILGDILAPEPPSTAPSAYTAPFQPVTPPSNDPGQFHIPGQQ
jgi:hypothetical protein